jgi:hypothetical protein
MRRGTEARRLRDPAPGRPARRGWYWLLLVPCAGSLWVPAYAHANPTVAGLPFFYWYLLLWVILSAGITGLVYILTR